MLSLTQIAEIAAETAQDTLEDLETVTEGLKVFAEAVLVVSQTLQQTPSLIAPDTRSRSLRVNDLSAKIMAQLDERWRRPDTQQ